MTASFDEDLLQPLNVTYTPGNALSGYSEAAFQSPSSAPDFGYSDTSDERKISSPSIDSKDFGYSDVNVEGGGGKEKSDIDMIASLDGSKLIFFFFFFNHHYNFC